jgi:LysR family nitrogen assimilation transcriptional regulator
LAFRGTLQDIRLFVAAYETGSFTAAAARENTTQSGVSHHIRQLERLLGVQLFLRDKLGVAVTPAADAFYGRSVDMLRAIDGACHDVAPYAKGYRGSFTVGMIPALTHRMAAPALLRFSETHPNVKVRIVEGFSSFLPQMVTAGDIDFAISTLHGGETGVRARPLLTTPECLVSRSSGADEPALATELPKAPINMAWASYMEKRRAIISACLTAHGVVIDQSIDIDSALAMLDLVGRSDWKTVTPCFMIDPVVDAKRFTIRPLRNPDVNFEVMLIERTSRVLSEEAEAFVEILAGEARRATEDWIRRFRLAGLMQAG